ncbi:MAG: DUF1127 domain-containing protein [Oceanospirillaceae bacterium]|uniref:DUF1127 domain-containing protein n=1 Tax=Marinobacterium litorale TaxID=404770 RepID=UPI00040FE442|nr:DUF1127 domain-containing protein [Marinobacterium litorale]MBS99547.1 DUF1127 domain-containing protein [Oceanospirillaceae bacterium]
MKSLAVTRIVHDRKSAVRAYDLWPRVRKTLWLWYQRYRQRRQLARLAPEMLKDIGISRSDALQESKKPFWQR